MSTIGEILLFRQQIDVSKIRMLHISLGRSLTY